MLSNPPSKATVLENLGTETVTKQTIQRHDHHRAIDSMEHAMKTAATREQGDRQAKVFHKKCRPLEQKDAPKYIRLNPRKAPRSTCGPSKNIPRHLSFLLG